MPTIHTVFKSYVWSTVGVGGLSNQIKRANGKTRKGRKKESRNGNGLKKGWSIEIKNPSLCYLVRKRKSAARGRWSEGASAFVEENQIKRGMVRQEKEERKRVGMGMGYM